MRVLVILNVTVLSGAIRTARQEFYIFLAQAILAQAFAICCLRACFACLHDLVVFSEIE